MNRAGSRVWRGAAFAALLLLLGGGFLAWRETSKPLPPLGNFPGVRLTQDWAYADSYGRSCTRSPNESFPLADGGLIHLQDGNFYALDGKGHTVPGLRALFAFDNLQPMPEGGLAASLVDDDKPPTVMRVAPDGSISWRITIADSLPEMNNYWLPLAPALGGELFAMESRHVWRLNSAGKVLQRYPRKPAQGELVDSLPLEHDALLLTQEVTPKGASTLRLEKATGATLWNYATGILHGCAEKAELWPDGSALVSVGQKHLLKLDANGKLAWKKFWEVPSFDGRSFTVTSAGLIVVWFDGQLHFLNPDGTPAASAAGLGFPPLGDGENMRDLTEGLDGNIYVNRVGRGEWPKRTNTLLCCSPAGQPLWHAQLGEGYFSLLAVNANGQLFVRKEGKVLSHGGIASSTTEVEIVRLTVKP